VKGEEWRRNSGLHGEEEERDVIVGVRGEERTQSDPNQEGESPTERERTWITWCACPSGEVKVSPE